MTGTFQEDLFTLRQKLAERLRQVLEKIKKHFVFNFFFENLSVCNIRGLEL